MLLDVVVFVNMFLGTSDVMLLETHAIGDFLLSGKTLNIVSRCFNFKFVFVRVPVQACIGVCVCVCEREREKEDAVALVASWPMVLGIYMVLALFEKPILEFILFLGKTLWSFYCET